MKQQMAEMKADPNSVGQAGQPPQVPGAKTSQPAAAGQASAGPPPKTTVVPMPPPPMPGAFGQAAMPPGPPAIGTTADDASQGVIGAIEVYSFKQSDAKDRTAEKKAKIPWSTSRLLLCRRRYFLAWLQRRWTAGKTSLPRFYCGLTISPSCRIGSRQTSRDASSSRRTRKIERREGSPASREPGMFVQERLCRHRPENQGFRRRLRRQDWPKRRGGLQVRGHDRQVAHRRPLRRLGDSIQAQTQTQSISALGTTNTIDTDKVWQAGIGGGLSTASHEIQKFYMELARQTLPVIEVGAVRDVTIVVSEGVETQDTRYRQYS